MLLQMIFEPCFKKLCNRKYEDCPFLLIYKTKVSFQDNHSAAQRFVGHTYKKKKRIKVRIDKKPLFSKAICQFPLFLKLAQIRENNLLPNVFNLIIHSLAI